MSERAISALVHSEGKLRPRSWYTSQSSPPISGPCSYPISFYLRPLIVWNEETSRTARDWGDLYVGTFIKYWSAAVSPWECDEKPTPGKWKWKRHSYGIYLSRISVPWCLICALRFAMVTRKSEQVFDILPGRIRVLIINWLLRLISRRNYSVINQSSRMIMG